VLWARAAQLAAPGVPIVFEGVDDPVARCLVDSLRRPGRNATGYMHYLPSDDFKAVETLLDAFPHLSRVVFLVDAQGVMPLACDGTPAAPADADGDCRAGLREPDAYLDRRLRATELRAFGRARGVAVDFAVLCGAQDIAGLEGRLGARDAAGLVVPTQDLFETERAQVVEAVNRARLPAIYQTHASTAAGGLMSLAPILDVNADRVSVRTAVEVWRGRDPRTLPVQSPRGFSLAVNVTTARQTGLVPSAFTLKRADRVLRPPDR
jgi:putative ABC transport system substrate-binding protein